MPTFGLIAEGPTDHVVLENILIGHFNDPDLTQSIRELQPLRDATDALQGFGGWYNVFEYCRSELFRDAFIQNDYLLIQIDTDCSSEPHYDVPRAKDESVEHFIERIIAKFRAMILERFGEVFYQKYEQKILFAISVDEIECWLLPLYYDNKTRSSTNNCLYKLNQKLAKENLKPIVPENKDYKTYQKISRQLQKPKTLKNCYPHNPSFNYFVLNFLEKL